MAHIEVKEVDNVQGEFILKTKSFLDSQSKETTEGNKKGLLVIAIEENIPGKGETCIGVCGDTNTLMYGIEQFSKTDIGRLIIGFMTAASFLKSMNIEIKAVNNQEPQEQSKLIGKEVSCTDRPDEVGTISFYDPNSGDIDIDFGGTEPFCTHISKCKIINSNN